MYLMGFDIGGTKIEVNLLSLSLKDGETSLRTLNYQKENHSLGTLSVLSKKRLPTERAQGYDQMIAKLAQLTFDVCRSHNLTLSEIAVIGLSLPGPIDPKTNTMLVSNSMVFTKHNVAQDLQESLKEAFQDAALGAKHGHTVPPVVGANDANCFALAEVLCGAGLEHFQNTGIPVYEQLAVGLILGSGTGGGLILNGRIVAGNRGGACEVGHSILHSEGHPCYCGQRGCAEQYLCGPALEAAMANRIYAQIHKRPTATEVFELYHAQDPMAIAVVKQLQSDLALFLGNLSNVFDPHYFVLGGGLSLQPVLYEGLPTKGGAHTFLPTQDLTVYQHRVGDSAGAIGAALHGATTLGLSI